MTSVRGFLTLKYQHASCVFLPRDAMLAQYMLSSSVRPSVCPSICPSQAGSVSIETTGRIELVFCMWASFRLSHIVLGKFWYLQKLEYFTLKLCPKFRT